VSRRFGDVSRWDDAQGLVTSPRRGAAAHHFVHPEFRAMRAFLDTTALTFAPRLPTAPTAFGSTSVSPAQLPKDCRLPRTGAGRRVAAGCTPVRQGACTRSDVGRSTGALACAMLGLVVSDLMAGACGGRAVTDGEVTSEGLGGTNAPGVTAAAGATAAAGRSAIGTGGLATTITGGTGMSTGGSPSGAAVGADVPILSGPLDQDGYYRMPGTDHGGYCYTYSDQVSGGTSVITPPCDDTGGCFAAVPGCACPGLAPQTRRRSSGSTGVQELDAIFSKVPQLTRLHNRPA